MTARWIPGCWSVLCLAVLGPASNVAASGARPLEPPARADVFVADQAPSPAPRGRAEILVMRADGSSFRLRTTFERVQGRVMPAVERGYSLFCGTWRTSAAGTVTVADALKESYRYPALTADRDGVSTRTFTRTGSGTGAGEGLRGAGVSYAIKRVLRFAATQQAPFWFVCDAHKAADVAH